MTEKVRIKVDSYIKINELYGSVLSDYDSGRSVDYDLPDLDETEVNSLAASLRGTLTSERYKITCEGAGKLRIVDTRKNL